MKILSLIIIVLFLSCGRTYNGTIFGDYQEKIKTVYIFPHGKWDVEIKEGLVTLTDTLNLVQIHYMVGMLSQDIIDTCYGTRIPKHDSLVPAQIDWKRK